MNLRLLVCPRCMDKPFEHHRPLAVPPDPVPVRNPRPDLYRPLLAFIVSDTTGTEVNDAVGAFHPVTATSAAAPNGQQVQYLRDGDGSLILNGQGTPIGSGLPAPAAVGAPVQLANEGMYDDAFDGYGVAVRDTSAAAVYGAQLTDEATGVLSAPAIDGYMLRADAGGPVFLIPE